MVAHAILKWGKQPVIVFLDSQLGLIVMQSTSTINNS